MSMTKIGVGLDFTADITKAKTTLLNLLNTLNLITTQSVLNVDVNTAGLKNASAAAQELQLHLIAATNVDTGRLDLVKLNASLMSAKTSLSSLSSQLMEAGTTGNQAFLQLAQSVAAAEMPVIKTSAALDKMLVTLKNTARWLVSSAILKGVMLIGNSAVSYVKELDTSLNRILMVTKKTTEQMREFGLEANKAAKALNTTTTAYTNAALIFAQQGLNDEQIKERTEVTLKMANITKLSSATVSDQMTAIWNNFYDGSKSLEYYADAITALGAATASSSDEIAGGLEKFAAVADTVGLSYETSTAALATVVAKTRQSEDIVGTAFKTIFARIQSLDLGESLDDGTTLTQYSEALNKVGVNILDVSGNLKDMDVILDETGSKWESLSKAQLVSLAQTVAGTRLYSQFIALMDNWKDVEENRDIALYSEGELEAQQEIYEKSYTASMNRLKAATESLYDNLINSDLMIWINDTGAKAIGVIDNLTNSGLKLGSLIFGILGIVVSSLSSKIGPAINLLLLNLMIKLGGTEIAYSNINSLMQLSIALFLQEANLTDEQNLKLQHSAQLISMKAKLAAAGNLSEKEAAEANTLILIVTALLELIESVNTKINKLKEYIATLNEELETLTTINGLVGAMDKTNASQRESSWNASVKAGQQLNQMQSKIWNNKDNIVSQLSNVKVKSENQQEYDNAIEKLGNKRKSNTFTQELENIVSQFQDEIKSGVEAFDAVKIFVEAKKELELEMQTGMKNFVNASSVSSSTKTKLATHGMEMATSEGVISSIKDSTYSSLGDVRTAFDAARKTFIESGYGDKEDELMEPLTNSLQTSILELTKQAPELTDKLNSVSTEGIEGFIEKLEILQTKLGNNTVIDNINLNIKSANTSNGQSLKKIFGSTDETNTFLNSMDSLSTPQLEAFIGKMANAGGTSSEQFEGIQADMGEKGTQAGEEYAQALLAKVKQVLSSSKFDSKDIGVITGLSKQFKELSKDTKDLSENIRKADKAEELLNKTVLNFNPVHTASFSERLTAIAGTAMLASMAINAVQSAWDAWSSEDMSFMQKLTTTMMSFSMIMPVVTKSIGLFTSGMIKFGTASKAASESSALLNKIQQTDNITRKGNIITINAEAHAFENETAAEQFETAAKRKLIVASIMENKENQIGITGIFKGIAARMASTVAIDESTAAIVANRIAKYLEIAAIIAVVAALGALIAILVKVTDAEYLQAKRLEEAKEELAKMKEETEAVTSAYNDLKTTIEDYHDAKTSLEKLTSGTLEWKELLSEANEKALELIETYSNLKWTVDNGQIVIDEDSLKDAYETLYSKLLQSNALTLLKRADVKKELNKLNLILDEKSFSKFGLNFNSEDEIEKLLKAFENFDGTIDNAIANSGIDLYEEEYEAIKDNSEKILKASLQLAKLELATRELNLTAILLINENAPKNAETAINQSATADTISEVFNDENYEAIMKGFLGSFAKIVGYIDKEAAIGKTSRVGSFFDYFVYHNDTKKIDSGLGTTEVSGKLIETIVRAVWDLAEDEDVAIKDTGGFEVGIKKGTEDKYTNWSYTDLFEKAIQSYLLDPLNEKWNSIFTEEYKALLDGYLEQNKEKYKIVNELGFSNKEGLSSEEKQERQEKEYNLITNKNTTGEWNYAAAGYTFKEVEELKSQIAILDQTSEEIKELQNALNQYEEDLKLINFLKNTEYIQNYESNLISNRTSLIESLDMTEAAYNEFKKVLSEMPLYVNLTSDLLEKVAYESLKLSKNIKTLKEETEDYTDILDDLAKGLTANIKDAARWGNATAKIKQSILDIISVDLDDSFFDLDTWSIILKAINGTEEEASELFNELKLKADKQYLEGLSVPTEFEGQLASITSWIDDLLNMDPISLEFELKDSIIQQFNDLMAAGILTSELVEKILYNAGYIWDIAKAETKAVEENINAVADATGNAVLEMANSTPTLQDVEVKNNISGTETKTEGEFAVTNENGTLSSGNISATTTTYPTESKGSYAVLAMGDIRKGSAVSLDLGGSSSSSSSGGSSKSNKPKTASTSDRYKNIDKKISRTSDAISDALDTAKKKIGNSGLAYEKQAQSLIAQLIQLNQTGYQEALQYRKQDAASLQEALKQGGIKVSLDSDGSVVGYDYEKFQKWIDEYYNANMSKTGDNTELDDWYSNVTDYLKNYEDSDDKAYEYQLAIKELGVLMFDSVVEGFLTLIDTLDLIKEIADKQASFQEKVLDERYNSHLNNSNEYSELYLNMAATATADAESRLGLYTLLKNAIDSGNKDTNWTTYLSKNSLEQLLKYGLSPEDLQDETKMIELMQQLVEDMEDDWSTAADNIKSIFDNVTSAFDEYDAELEKFKTTLGNNSAELSEYQALLKLQGLTNKTTAGYKANSKVILANIKIKLAERKDIEAQIAARQKQLADLKAAAATYSPDSVEYKAAMEQIEEVEKELHSNTIDRLKNIQEEILAIEDLATATIENIMANAEDLSTNGLGFDWLSSQLDYLIEDNEKYLDSAELTYELNKLLRSIASDINSASANKRSTSAYKALLDEIELMSERNDISEYELKMLQSKYDITKALMELEEVLNSKSTARLVRNAQGNWTYLFTANQSEVDKAQLNYEDKVAAGYENAKEQAKSAAQNIIKTYENFYKELTELEEEYRAAQTDDEKEKVASKITTLKTLFYNDMAYQNSLFDLAKSGLQSYATLYGIAYDSAFVSSLESFISVTDNYRSVAESTVSDFYLACQTAEKEISEVLSETGTDVTTLSSNIDSLGTSADTTSSKISTFVREAGEKLPKLNSEENLTAILTISNKFTTLATEIKKAWGELETLITKVKDVPKEITVPTVNNTNTSTNGGATPTKTNNGTVKGGSGEGTSGTGYTSSNTTKTTEQSSTVNDTEIQSAMTTRYNTSNPIAGLKTSTVLAIFKSNGGRFQGGGTSVVLSGLPGSSCSAPKLQYRTDLHVFKNWSPSFNGKYPLSNTTYTAQWVIYTKQYAKNVLKGTLFKFSPNDDETYVFDSYKQGPLDDILGKSYIYYYKRNGRTKLSTEIIGTDIYTGYKDSNNQAHSISFDTGGYTGDDWNSANGKLAFLHEKELVLNKEDTLNILEAVKSVRDISDSTISLIINRINALSDLSKYALQMQALVNNFNTEKEALTIDLNVKIEANFPSVTLASEIEEALNDLVNAAAQRAGIMKY